MQGHPLDDTVRAVVAQHLDVPADHLTGDASLEELGLDDDTAANVLVAVGEELDVRFPDDFFDGVDTYGQLTSAVRMAIGA
ncbi:MAG: phosphopantetheine-binding protein [Kineosporiaceae bacterium]|jgi:acyl carrier protein